MPRVNEIPSNLVPWAADKRNGESASAMWVQERLQWQWDTSRKAMERTSFVLIFTEGFLVKYFRLRPGSPHCTLSGTRLECRDDECLFLNFAILLNFATAYPWPFTRSFSYSSGVLPMKIATASFGSDMCQTWSRLAKNPLVFKLWMRSVFCDFCGCQVLWWVGESRGESASKSVYGLWRILMLFRFLFHLSEAVASSFGKRFPVSKKNKPDSSWILFGIDAREPSSWRHVWLIHSTKLFTRIIPGRRFFIKADGRYDRYKRA